MNEVWVTMAPGLPFGARRITGAPDVTPPDGVWLDVCIMGQHLPQIYRSGEITQLTAAGCARLGLCPDCLGFGDLDEIPGSNLLLAARGIDEIARPCPGCCGSGRPSLRITITRGDLGPDSVTGSIRPLPHAYVPPLEAVDPDIAELFEFPPDSCLACGMPPGGQGPDGLALHPAAA